MPPALIEGHLRSSNHPQSCVNKGASGGICAHEALGREQKMPLVL